MVRAAIANTARDRIALVVTCYISFSQRNFPMALQNKARTIVTGVAVQKREFYVARTIG